MRAVAQKEGGRERENEREGAKEKIIQQRMDVRRQKRVQLKLLFGRSETYGYDLTFSN